MDSHGIDVIGREEPKSAMGHRIVMTAAVLLSSLLLASCLTACSGGSDSRSAQAAESSGREAGSGSDVGSEDDMANGSGTVPDGYVKGGETDGGTATIYVPGDSDANGESGEAGSDGQASGEAGGEKNAPSTETDVANSGLDDSIGESEVIVAN